MEQKARLFGFVVQKGSDLVGGKPIYKGRIVVQGNDVKDEEGNEALFNELGASPATLESAKLVDAFGLLPGHDITTDDGCQAYCQALLGETIPGPNPCDQVQRVETWVVIPEESRPTWWKDHFYDPVVRLVRALYGHPDSGGYWELKCSAALTASGFVLIDEAFNSLWYNKEKAAFLWYMSTTSKWPGNLLT